MAASNIKNFLLSLFTKIKRYFKLIYKLITTRGRFDNISSAKHEIEVHDEGFLHFVQWFRSELKSFWSVPSVQTAQTVPAAYVEGDRLRITAVGHTTFLIQWNGLNILTDPVWSERVGPGSWIGPKRITKPGIAFACLPKIDLVLISHNHYDHLDTATLAKLWQHSRPQFFMPSRNQEYLEGIVDSTHIKVMEWYDHCEFKPFRIHLRPARHWSGRMLIDNNYALWGSFILEEIESGQAMVFLCDTAYDQKISQEIATSFPKIRLSIIPIGAYEPRKLMHLQHVNPDEAVRTHIDLQSNFSVASHFGTFKLSSESYQQPCEDLQIAKDKYGVADKDFIALTAGQSFEC